MNSTGTRISACLLVVLLALGIAQLFPTDSMLPLSRTLHRSVTAVHSYTGLNIGKIVRVPLVASYSMSSGDHQTTSQTAPEGTQEKPQGETLALPGPEEGETTVLDVSSGQSVSLDHLGPMVVNTDGSLSRINNWAEMSAIEQKTTLKIIGKRNKQRLQALKDQESKA